MLGGGGIFGFEAYGGEPGPIKPGPTTGSGFGPFGFEPYGAECAAEKTLGLDPITITARQTPEEAEASAQADGLKKLLPIGLGIAAVLFLMRGR